jgi:hypothetical protein
MLKSPTGRVRQELIIVHEMCATCDIAAKHTQYDTPRRCVCQMLGDLWRRGFARTELPGAYGTVRDLMLHGY